MTPLGWLAVFVALGYALAYAVFRAASDADDAADRLAMERGEA